MLDLAEPLPGGRRFVSAASGLAVVDAHFVVAADDAHHLAIFACGSSDDGRTLRVLVGDLPNDPRERKARKPDFEALTLLPATGALPNGALLAVGSGSTPNRDLAVVIELDAFGRLTDHVHRRSLSPFYDPLREDVGDVNIEGAFILGGELVLLSRANGSVPDNHIAHVALDAVAPWLEGTSSAPVKPRSVTAFRIGEIGGVPLGVTDGAPHPNGGWVFSAAAEDTSDSYHDGAVAGAAVGVVDSRGEVIYLARLEPDAKVEGIVASVLGGRTVLTMVTDGDDPDLPASLLVAVLPE